MSVLDLAILCLSLVCFFSMHHMHIQSVSPLANWLGRVGFSKKKSQLKWQLMHTLMEKYYTSWQLWWYPLLQLWHNNILLLGVDCILLHNIHEISVSSWILIFLRSQKWAHLSVSSPNWISIFSRTISYLRIHAVVCVVALWRLVPKGGRGSAAVYKGGLYCKVHPRYNRKGTLSGIPNTGAFLVQGPKIPRQFR